MITQETKRTKSKPVTTPAIEMFDAYVSNLLNGHGEKLTKLGCVLNGIEIGPKLLTVIGAAPGAGKTCLAMQVCFEALERDKDLKVTVANAETSFDGLARRELCRLTGIPSRRIRLGDLNDVELEKIRQAAADLRPCVERINTVEDCKLGSLLALASEPPGLLVVDYLQKFAPLVGDARLGVNSVMGHCRQLAKNGWAVVALSATSRTNGKGGSGHDSSQLNQASFRESGDIEYNADACYLLVDQGAVNHSKPYEFNTLLKCVKNRHDEPEDRELIFDKRRQRFRSPIELDVLSQNASIENLFGGSHE
jgi:replicative DNA helicase